MANTNLERKADETAIEDDDSNGNGLVLDLSYLSSGEVALLDILKSHYSMAHRARYNPEQHKVNEQIISQIRDKTTPYTSDQLKQCLRYFSNLVVRRKMDLHSLGIMHTHSLRSSFPNAGLAYHKLAGNVVRMHDHYSTKVQHKFSQRADLLAGYSIDKGFQDVNVMVLSVKDTLNKALENAREDIRHEARLVA